MYEKSGDLSPTLLHTVYHLPNRTTSIWKLIEGMLPYSEQQEVKNIIGVGLVEESVQLNSELETLQEIFKEYQQENPGEIHVKIPEPPTARESLVKEIAFLVSSITEKANSNGKNSSQILSKYNKQILEYVSKESKEYKRTNQSSPSSINHQSVTSNLNQNNTNCVEEEVKHLIDSLDYLDINYVANQLRPKLEEEIRQLLGNTEFLQNSLDTKGRSTGKGGNVAYITDIPSISDLRLERKLLEEELLKKLTNCKMATHSTETKTQMKKQIPSMGSDRAISGRHRIQHYKKADLNSQSDLTKNKSLDSSKYRFLPHPPDPMVKGKINSAEKFRRMIENSRVAH